jgi:EAL domain-containing protein (putative c-di-GMP-specific phosphodiesterase class I)/ActR/RegA family two-component response regulator
MHLLVFDDDERMADIVAAIGCDCGWTTAKATSATDFWAAYQANRPDAIVLDMRLGRSDGIEQLRLLSGASFTGSVVLMSGVDPRVLVSAQEVGRSLGLAVRAVIEKPVRAARVRSVLAALQAAGEPRETATDAAAAADPNQVRITPAMVAQALKAGQMELHLQPIVSSKHQKPVGAEGLVRWYHPVRGLLPPSEFVPVAEEDQRVIDQLTAWAIETAALQYRDLAAQGLAVPINVNVSGRNLHALDFPDRIAALLDGLGVPPEAIGFEITETVAMEDRRLTADILTRLRLKGISLSIDDFGTGHSTLESLRRMPFSTIKIERSFVADLLTSHDAFNIVRSIIDLARTMGLTSVAEGVEDKRVADCLIELGVDSMQGYGFARPLPLPAFVAWLRDEQA